jgi:Tol biopolymer transport system component
MKIWKAILCVLIVSLLVSMAIPMACAPKPPNGGGKPPKDEPPADPAIAYYSTTSGPRPNKIMVMNDDGSNQAVVYEEYFGTSGISWSLDGQSIAWSGSTYIPNVPGYNTGIWRMDIEVVDGEPQGTNLQQLVSLEYSGNGAAWSPLGDEIAFATRTDPPSPETGGLSNKILVVPVTGGDYEVIYTAPDGSTGVKSPTWSSDGTRIAFTEVEMSTGDRCIKVIDKATGATTHTLVKGQFYIEWVDWARQDSNTLAFYDAGMTYSLDIDSGTPNPVLQGIMPSWSPDNSKILYRQTGKKDRLCTFEFSTGEITPLNNGGTLPDWRRF